MIGLLARRNLRRSLTRTLLLVAGVTIAGALLFDMSMLAGGLETSLGEILGQLGYEIRVVPRGTLPLGSEEVIPHATQTARAIAAQPGVAWVAPVLATNLYATIAGRRMAAVAVGMTEELTGIVRLRQGRSEFHGLIINPAMATALHVGPGEMISLSPRISPQTSAAVGTVQRRIEAIGEFVFDLSSQGTIALPLDDLQHLLGLPTGEASFLVVKLRPGVDPEVAAQRIGEAFPEIDALSIPELLRRAGSQLTYFNQFALVLSVVSLLVTLLLIGAVLTLQVGERLGEFAILRAVGLSRVRLVLLLLLEGAILAIVCLPLALVLGAAASRPLDAILRAAPGVPQELHFFVSSPTAVVRTVVLLLVTATLGAGYPAWVAGRLNVAATLHGEIQ